MNSFLELFPNNSNNDFLEKNLFFIRHGETDFNKKGIVQGRKVNASLNETGRNQAKSFYDLYKNNGFDMIYTSTLNRSIETVQSFIDNGIPFEKLAGLDEIDWGNMEGKIPDEHSRKAFEITLQKWKNGELNHGMENGETPTQLHDRQVQAMKIIMESKFKNILVCMHGRAMRLLLCYLSEKNFCDMDDFPHQNLSLYHLFYSKNQFNIVAFNDLKHLQ